MLRGAANLALIGCPTTSIFQTDVDVFGLSQCEIILRIQIE